MSADAAAISLENVTKSYPGDPPVHALRDVTLGIPGGEIYGLIGPNGAGKTTLMRLVSTLISPTSGRLTVLGHDCEDDREAVCGRIGFMPELFALYEELTVYEYLEFFAGAYGIPREKRKRDIEAVVELTDLGVRQNSFAGTLSKGMRQRLLLAKTLIHDPDVLLLDEPTSGMDPQARIEFRNIVRTLRKMGKTILISSHILSDLSVMCSSFGIVERGRLQLTGSLDEVTRAMQLKSEIVVEYLATDLDTRSMVRHLEGVQQVRVRGQTLRFAFEGDDEAKSAILKALVDGGVRVTRFDEKKRDLEDIFMEFGATQVQ